MRSRPLVLGLTGSIGMGKSTTAAMFIRHGIAVHDSDASVHALYASDGVASRAIRQLFPDVITDTGVDRAKLRALILQRPETLKEIEAIVHPLVQDESRRFLQRHQDDALVVLDIPLLFETGAEERCDAIVVVTASQDIQRERVLARPGMTEKAFYAILAKQMPDEEKRRRADFVIDTGHGLAHAERQVEAIIARLTTSETG